MSVIGVSLTVSHLGIPREIGRISKVCIRVGSKRTWTGVWINV